MRKIMKATNALILIIVSIALLASCSENPGTTTMKLILSMDVENGSRTLLPADSSLLDVTRYTITGNGPNGKTFTTSTDSPSTSIQNLAQQNTKYRREYKRRQEIKTMDIRPTGIARTRLRLERNLKTQI